MRVFLLQRRLKNLGGKAKVPLKRVHVVGAGVMGGDIAAWCANGLNVTLQDRRLKFIEPSLKRAREGFEALQGCRRGRRAHDARITADIAWPVTAFRCRCDHRGDLQCRRQHELHFARLEPRMGAQAILASNTSSIMLEQLDDNLPDPGRLVGIHFFNPVARCPWSKSCAVKPAAKTRYRRASHHIEVAAALQGAPGFLVNRVLVPYL